MRFFPDPNSPALRSLTDEQRFFFVRIIPLAQRIQQQIIAKCEDHGTYDGSNRYIGIYASIIAADILVNSNFGEHPLSKEKFSSRANGNNLNLSLSNHWWEHDHDSILLDGQKYKCYADLHEFGNNQSDEYVYSEEFYDILLTADHAEQVRLLGRRRFHIFSDFPAWENRINHEILRFRLREYDITASYHIS